MTKFEEARLKTARSQMRYNFIKEHCEMPAHWCATGIPIPEDARAFPADPGVILRRRQPCHHWDHVQGCTNIKHPKYSEAWEGR